MSAIFCFFVLLFKYHSLILYSSFVLLKLVKQKLFVFNIFEIWNTMNLLIVFYLFFNLSFLFIYLSLSFISSSFYKKQIKYIKNFLGLLTIYRLIIFFILNFLVLYFFLYLLIYWKFTTILSSFSLFKIQIKLFNYIQVWLKINCNLLILFDTFFLINFLIYIYLNILKFFIFFKSFKNKILFFSLIISLIFISDYVYVFLIWIICLELYYFFLCYKVFLLLKNY